MPVGRLQDTYARAAAADLYHEEIGDEQTQEVINDITSSYAAEGQAAPQMSAPGQPPGMNFRPPGGKLFTGSV